jgi:hypothetical protein
MSSSLATASKVAGYLEANLELTASLSVEFFVTWKLSVKYGRKDANGHPGVCMATAHRDDRDSTEPDTSFPGNCHDDTEP